MLKLVLLALCMGESLALSSSKLQNPSGEVLVKPVDTSNWQIPSPPQAPSIPKDQFSAQQALNNAQILQSEQQGLWKQRPDVAKQKIQDSVNTVTHSSQDAWQKAQQGYTGALKSWAPGLFR